MHVHIVHGHVFPKRRGRAFLGASPPWEGALGAKGGREGIAWPLKEYTSRRGGWMGKGNRVKAQPSAIILILVVLAEVIGARVLRVHDEDFQMEIRNPTEG